MELQELYNSQQLLTAELTDKLEKTEVRYQLTEYLLILCVTSLEKFTYITLFCRKSLRKLNIHWLIWRKNIGKQMRPLKRRNS